MIKINHYEVLNIPRDADKSTIKRAYFSLVKIYTPDKEPNRFRTIRDAYDTLMDDNKRTQYDGFFSGPDYLQEKLIPARELVRRSKLKQAIEMLTDMVREHPNENEVSRLLANAYNKNKNNGKAQKICEDLLRKNPNDIDTRLLLAEVYRDRGYVVKAEEQYVHLIETYPEKQETWSAYIKFLLREKFGTVRSYNLNGIINRALQVSEDIFEDEYDLYIHCACHAAGMYINDFIQSEAYAKDVERYFNLFVRFFAADKRPTLGIYNIAVNGLGLLVNNNIIFPHMESLLTVLLDCGHRQPHHDETLIRISNSILFIKLKADKRIKEALVGLVQSMIKGCDCKTCKYTQTVLEHNIVFDAASSRRQIAVLKESYPDLFKLNETFFMDMLNRAKESSLQSKYRSEARRLDKMITKSKKSSVFDLDFLDDYFDDDVLDELDGFDSSDIFGSPDKTFVRESPKVGRNEPCPCGSGKKYKKCCGAV